MLCYRCEARAMFMETSEWKNNELKKRGYQPRMECGDITNSKYACYAYKPCRPVKVEPLDKNDPRPIFGPSMISSRVMASKDKPNLLLDYCSFKDGGAMAYWSPAKDVLNKAIKSLDKKIKKSKSLKNIKFMQIRKKELRLEKKELKD